MKSVKKLSFRNFIFLFTALFAVSCSLSNNCFEETSPSRPIVRFSLSDNQKTAMPEINAKEFENFTLEITSDLNRTYSRTYVFMSEDEMKNSSIELNEGKYIFTLYASYDNAYYSDIKSIDVKNGMNVISFNLGFVGYSGGSQGKGDVDIRVRYPLGKVKCVKAGLYSLSGNIITGYAPEVIAQSDTVQEASYKKTSVFSGSYIIKFNFYGDIAASDTMLLGTYQEYLLIVKDKTTTADIEVPAVGNMYTINYNLKNAGTIKEGENPVVSYSRLSPLIKLPELSYNDIKYNFEGWYASEDYSDGPYTYWEPSSAKNVTFYAKWKVNKTMIFDANGKNFSFIKDGLTVTNPQREIKIKFESESTGIIPTVSELGLDPIGNAFLGWTLIKDDISNIYKDGEKFSFENMGDTITVFALYSKSNINPSGKADKTDTDGDGISDWDELNIHHTDPNSTDTDGDGFDDKWEIENFVPETNIFNPRIADLPNITIELKSMPQIYRNRVIQTSSGVSQTTSITESNGETYTHTDSDSKTSGYLNGWSVGVKYELGFLSDDTNKLGFELGYNGNHSWSTTTTFSDAQSKNWSKSLQNGKTITDTETQINQGGSVEYSIFIKNKGNIAYNLQNLSLTLDALKYVGDSIYAPVKTGTISTPMTMAPGSSTHTDLTLQLTNDQLEFLLKNSKGMRLDVSGFTLNAQIGNKTMDFTNSYTQTNAKCADLTISFGDALKQPRMYKISTKTKYNSQALSTDEVYAPLTLRDALAEVGISEITENSLNKLVLDGKKIKSIGGIEAEADTKKGDWYIMITHIDSDKNVKQSFYTNHPAGSDKVVQNYDIDNIFIRPQDIVNVFYDVDMDGDGVGRSVELSFGTKDDNTDTDGDGLSDFEEIYGFKKEGKVFRTNPCSVDTDDDASYHPLSPEDWNDKNDPDPVTPADIETTGLAQIQYSVDGITYKDLNVEDSISITENVYDYLYLKLKTLNNRMVPKVAAPLYNGNAGSEYVTYNRSEIVKVLLAPEKKNTVKIKITDDKDVVSKEYILTVNSTFKELQKTYIVESKEVYKSQLTLPAYYDARLDRNSFEYKGYGFILAASKNKINLKDTEINFEKVQNALNNPYSTGLEPLLTSDETYHLYSFDIGLLQNAISNVFKFKNNDQRKITYFKIFAYAVDKDNNVYAKEILAKDCNMKIPSIRRISLILDNFKAVEDHDNGYEPEYYVNFSSFPSVFSPVISDADFRQKMCDNVQHYKRWYDFESKTVSGNQRTQGTGKKFDLILNTNDSYTAVVKFHITEIDVCSDDNLGDHSIKFTYNKITDSVYLTAENCMNLINCNLYPSDTVHKSMLMNHSDGDTELYFTVKYEIVWP